MQIVRSVSQWSAGTSQTEDSIHKAYCSLIETAEHFVYIEVKCNWMLFFFLFKWLKFRFYFRKWKEKKFTKNRHKTKKKISYEHFFCYIYFINYNLKQTDHFIICICLQNQFFISGLSQDEIIQNRVLEALYRRILRAHKQQKCFRVIVVIPLLPGFQVLYLEIISYCQNPYFKSVRHNHQ